MLQYGLHALHMQLTWYTAIIEFMCMYMFEYLCQIGLAGWPSDKPANEDHCGVSGEPQQPGPLEAVWVAL